LREPAIETKKELQMEKVSYLNQPNCYRISGGAFELIVTTDIGPRILRYGFTGEENILGEVPREVIKTDFGDFKPWGGHRLWAAPEANPRSYVPENDPIEYEILDEHRIRLQRAADKETRIEKEMTVSLGDDGSVAIRHRLTNRGVWEIELAAWALTIMNGGGCVILPQEPFKSWDEELLPARPLVLWHYTDLSDPRWTINGNYIRLRSDETLRSPQKIGVCNKQGWAAYRRGPILFIKTFAYEEGATYPDYGSNNETYTAGSFIELESLGPLRRLAPGDSALHTERWHLFKNTDASDEALKTIIRKLNKGKEAFK
jgi:hypothetical protein